MARKQPVFNSAFRAIEEIVFKYFEGLHFGDTEILEAIFAEDCVLKAPGIRRTKREWLALVEARPTPSESGYVLESEIHSIEIIGNQAMVKVSVPLLGDHFIDYLGLLHENNSWLIVNKMYADRPEVKS